MGIDSGAEAEVGVMTSLSLIPRERPFEPLRRMSRDMDRLFDDVLSDWPTAMPMRFRHDWSEWQGSPRVDVTDRGSEFVLRAEVPGYRREDLHVDVGESSVSLRGERKEEKVDERECYVCRESSVGAFERTIPLPSEIRTEGVSAKLKDGVLTLALPKVHEEHRRQIEVKEE